MDHEALDRLSREELLELLAEQAEVLGRRQEELAEREAASERRDEKIRALEEDLAQFRRPAKTPENSSVPPSRGQQATRCCRLIRAGAAARAVLRRCCSSACRLADRDADQNHRKPNTCPCDQGLGSGRILECR